MHNSNEKEKLQFVRCVFERESKLYANTNKEYDMISKIWLDRYITKSNIDEILRYNINMVYEIALKLDKKTNLKSLQM